MTVYVDDMRSKIGRMIMCHMIADSSAELLAMADCIGVPRRWLQHAGRPQEHFDISVTKRNAAVTAGAVAIGQRECALMVARRRVSGELGKPGEARAWMDAWRAQRKAQQEELTRG